MEWTVGPRFRAWRARRRGWDADLVRAMRLPVPCAAQERARELVHQGKVKEAIEEIRTSTGYDRRDARGVVALALLYSMTVPTGRPRPLGNKRAKTSP
jgi:hypothetical protein